MRVPFNPPITFTVPTPAPSENVGHAPRSFPPGKPSRRRWNPEPRSVPRPRPLPKPGGNR
jgi:hypothetical protein